MKENQGNPSKICNKKKTKKNMFVIYVYTFLRSHRRF